MARSGLVSGVSEDARVSIGVSSFRGRRVWRLEAVYSRDCAWGDPRYWRRAHDAYRSFLRALLYSTYPRPRRPPLSLPKSRDSRLLESRQGGTEGRQVRRAGEFLSAKNKRPWHPFSRTPARGPLIRFDDRGGGPSDARARISPRRVENGGRSPATYR